MNDHARFSPPLLGNISLKRSHDLFLFMYLLKWTNFGLVNIKQKHKITFNYIKNKNTKFS